MSSAESGGSGRSGVVWSTIAFAGGKSLSIASTAVLARLLTPDDFGVVAAILVFVAFVELGGDLGMRSTIVYEQERGITPRVQTAFTINVVLVTLLTGLGLVLAAPVSSFFGLGDDVGLFRLACLAMPLRAFGNVADSLLLRELAFKQRIIPELGSSTVKAAVSISIAAIEPGAAALVWGVLAGNAVWSAMQWGLTGFRPAFTFDRTIARSMVGYGGMAATLEIVSVLTNRLDAIVIGRELGERALGLYTVAVRVPELAIDAMSWTVSRVAFPALSRRRANDPARLNAIALDLVRYQALYAVPLATGVAVMAAPILGVLFGPVWVEAAGVLAALATMSAAAAIAFPLGDVMKALGKQRQLVIVNLIQLPVLVTALIAAAAEGITTVAWARAALSIAFTITLIGLARRVAGIRLRELLRAAWPALATAAGVAAGAGAVRFALPGDAVGPLLAGTAAGALGGLAALWLLARSALKDAIELFVPERFRQRGAAT